MQNLFISLGISFFVTVAQTVTASAQGGPAGYDLIYDEPTNVNLAGRPVVADISLYADLDAAASEELRVALVTDVTDFIEQTERDLERWVATNQERCGERWKAGKPYIAFPQGGIRFALDLELQVWGCGFFGRGEPRMVAQESGRVDVTLDPYIEDGKLQARLRSFSVRNRRGISRYLPLEFVARRVINAELEALNQNRKFYRSPNPFYDEGFSYLAIGADKDTNVRVIITAIYEAQGDAATLDTLAQKIREEGITQEQ